MELFLSFAGGAAACALVLGWWIRRLQRQLASQPAAPAQDPELLAAHHQLQAQVDLLQHELQQGHQQIEQEQQRLPMELQSLEYNAQAKTQTLVDGALTHTNALSASLAELQGISKTFERWHADMSQLVAHNKGMHEKNDEFARIVSQMIIVALNASIEAARAGTTGQGFAVVANEMRTLSVRAETLSKHYRDNLYQNDLIATTVFQDMQAGGKMVINATTGLEITNRKVQAALQA